MATDCCKDCKDRVLGCHSTCERYKEFRAAMDERMRARQEQRKIDDYCYTGARKAQKRARVYKQKGRC